MDQFTIIHPTLAKSCSHWRRTITYEKIFDQWKSFKIDERRFSFHLKSSFRSQNIEVFLMSFWSSIKSGSIRKIWLFSKSKTKKFILFGLISWAQFLLLWFLWFHEIFPCQKLGKIPSCEKRLVKNQTLHNSSLKFKNSWKKNFMFNLHSKISI